MGIPPKTQALAKTLSYSSQTERKTPLLKTTPPKFTEHGERELVPTQNLHFNVLVSLVQEGSLQTTKKRNINTSPATNPLTGTGSCL